jgi:hypothetical protein
VEHEQQGKNRAKYGPMYQGVPGHTWQTLLFYFFLTETTDAEFIGNADSESKARQVVL